MSLAQARPSGRRVQIRSTGNITGIQPARQPAVPSFQGIANGFEAVKKAADGIADLAFKELEEDTRQEAKKKGRRFANRAAAEDKQPIIDASKIEQDTVFGQEFVKAAAQNFRDQTVIDVQSKAQELRAEHRGDPQAVAKELGAFVDSTLGEVPDAIRNQVEPELREITRLAVSDETVEATKRAQEQERVQGIEQVEKLSAQRQELIQEGNTDTPRYQQINRRLNEKISTLQDSGLITPAEGKELQDTADAAERQTVVQTRVQAIAKSTDTSDPASIRAARQKKDELVDKLAATAESPNARERLRETADSALTSALQERRQLQQAEEEQAQEAKLQNFLDLQSQLRACQDPRQNVACPTAQELKAADVTPRQRSRLLGDQQEITLDQDRERASELARQYKAGEISLSTFKDKVNPEVAPDAYNEAIKHARDQQERMKGASFDDFALHALANPSQYSQDEVRERADQALLDGTITRSRRRSFFKNFRQAQQDSVDKREQRRAMEREMEIGQPLSEKGMKAFARIHGEAANPITDDPENKQTAQIEFAKRTMEAGRMTDAARQQFESARSASADTAIQLSESYAALKASGPKGKGIISDELSNDTIQYLDKVNQLKDQLSPEEAVAEARKATTENVSSDRSESRVQGALSRSGITLKKGEDPVEAITRNMTSLAAQAGAFAGASDESPSSLSLGELVPILGDNTNVADIAEAIGIKGRDTPDARLRQQNISQQPLDKPSRDLIASKTHQLLASGKEETVGGAFKTALAQTLRERTPVHVEGTGKVTLAEDPLVATMNRDPNIPQGLFFDEDSARLDARFKLAESGIQPPKGADSWFDSSFRLSFEKVEGSGDRGTRKVKLDGEVREAPIGPEHEIMVERASGTKTPLIIEQKDVNSQNITSVPQSKRVRYTFDYKNSVQRDLMEAQLQRKQETAVSSILDAVGASSTKGSLSLFSGKLAARLSDNFKSNVLRLRSIDRTLKRREAGVKAAQASESAAFVGKSTEELRKMRKRLVSQLGESLAEIEQDQDTQRQSAGDDGGERVEEPAPFPGSAHIGIVPLGGGS